jgi:hypothetical protein
MKRVALSKIGPLRCAWCGCDDIRALEVNHKNGGGTKEYREIGPTLYRRIINGTRGVADLEILCSPDNRLEWLLRRFPDLKGRLTVTWAGAADPTREAP